MSEIGLIRQENDVVDEEVKIDWLMKHDIKQTFHELDSLFQKCLNDTFPITENGEVRNVDRFVLSTPSTTPLDQVKVVVTLSGQMILQADINFKLPRSTTSSGSTSTSSSSKDFSQHISLNCEQTSSQAWLLPQIQDAFNFLSEAADTLARFQDLQPCDQEGQDVVASSYSIREEKDALMMFLTEMLESVRQSHCVLIAPKKKTFQQLRDSQQMKCLVPNAPSEVALSFYIQGWRLVFAVYHLNNAPISNNANAASKPILNRYQAETVVPWLTEVIKIQNDIIHSIQQLLNKVAIH